MSYRIRLAKENFKFSCSHFTILGPDQAERLHGHNYYIDIELEVGQLTPGIGMAFDFNAVKPLVRAIADSFDEFVLLPERSPHLKVEIQGESISAKLGRKAYLFPTEDVRLLPCENITSEELARLIAETLATKMKAAPDLRGRVRSLAVGVEETRGQSATYQIGI